jgi:hypothetical protein
MEGVRQTCGLRTTRASSGLITVTGAQAIPPALAKRDVLGIAQTGTEKPLHLRCRFSTVSSLS